MEARGDSKAREHPKRCRQPSFSDRDKHRIREATTRYSRRGLDLVEIMFKLHEEGIADVPLDTFRTWIKEWKIPVQPRSRQPKFDQEKIRPHFEELYEQQYTLDQIVFIIYDRLNLPVTKSSYMKWRQKWGLPDRNSHVKLSPAEMTSEIEVEEIVDLSELSLDPDYALTADTNHVTTAPGALYPTDIPITAELMDYWMVDIDPQKLPDILEEGPEGSGDVLDDTINYDLLEEYPDDTVYSNPNATFDGQLSLIRPHMARLEAHRSPSPLSMERILSNVYEREMVSSIHTYFAWVRDPATGRLPHASHQRNDGGTRLAVAKRQTWSFYSLCFAAAQNSASVRPERQRRAQVEWARATPLITAALHQPTDRLLVCLLLLYTNAYSPGTGVHMRSQNFHYLYLLAMHVAGREHPLTHILRVLALPDVLPAAAEIQIMAYLVNSMLSIQFTDFDTSYEARELYILMLQKWNQLDDAKQHCDHLIQFVRDHGPADGAHLLRAQRRAGRIRFAQGRTAEARAIFRGIVDTWTAWGKPCTFAKEYVAFEDLAKICKFEGNYTDALAYYQQALSFSNLAYGCDHGNSLRIREDLDRLTQEMIARDSPATGHDNGGVQHDATAHPTAYLQR